MPNAGGQTQLIWDCECAGTAQAQSGSCLKIGPQTDWSAERLLVAAAESDLMSVFMRLAREAGLEVLGYISAAESDLHAEAAGRPRVVVRPCIVVGREEDRARVGRLVAQTGDHSPIARALGDTLQFQAEVVVVPPAAPD